MTYTLEQAKADYEALGKRIAELEKEQKPKPCPLEEGEKVWAHLSVDGVKKMIEAAEYTARPNQLACDVEVKDSTWIISSFRVSREEALAQARAIVDSGASD